MSPAHIHTTMNHFPIACSILAVILLALGLWRQSRGLEIGALVTLVIGAALAIPTYFSGQGAEEVVEDLNPVFREALVEPHEDAARIALIGAIVLGVLALYCLYVLSSRERLGTALASVMLVGTLIFAGVVGYTALLGGQISHPELRSGATIGGEHEEGDEGQEGEQEGEGEEDEDESFLLDHAMPWV